MTYRMLFLCVKQKKRIRLIFIKLSCISEKTNMKKVVCQFLNHDKNARENSSRGYGGFFFHRTVELLLTHDPFTTT